ncbi:hypothetical protein CBR_g19059 [Chara braunii]|uniref:Poly [ADP-ribose] polymerase n=1 Tax=Chara braunii TaxID=69332 RepID=A0A388KX83_CHABU|nr:hypothetical protein CBR_g19059 [Chara braunii]|eukprot:GBG74651.1 hypothetical protein CBR_g19059 [Chara braunii]
MGVGPSVHELARKGNDWKLSKRLQSGADANKPSPRSPVHRRPLHVAVRAGRLTTVSVLLSHGARVDATDDTGDTALHYAARTGDVQMADLLLQHGADHTIRNQEGCMPIHIAISCQNEAMQERLRSHALEVPVEFRYYNRNCWFDFEPGAANVLGFELGEGVNFTTLVVDDSRYIIDFVQQVQINAASLYTRSIAWKAGPDGAWRYPPQPYQGMHIGAEDPRYIAHYGLTAEPRNVVETHFEARNAASESVLFADQRQSATVREWRASPSVDLDSFDRDCDSGELRYAMVVSDKTDPLVVRRFGAHPSMFSLVEDGDEYYEVAGRFLRGMDKCSSSSAMQTPVRSTPGRRTPGSRPLSFSATPGRRALSIEGTPGRMTPSTPGWTTPSTTPGRMTPSTPLGKHVTVTAVHRVTVPKPRVNAFELYKADRMEARGDANVRWAWHGAPLGSLEKIILTGFSLQNKARNGNFYGCGIYLAPEKYAYRSAEYSAPDHTGEKHMLLCKVVLGSMEMVPFESTQFEPSGPQFDTGVDNLRDPSSYIVWGMNMNTFILPQYVVSFRGVGNSSSGGTFDSCVRDGERPGPNPESPGGNPERGVRDAGEGVGNAPSGGTFDSCVGDGDCPGRNPEIPGRNPERGVRDAGEGVGNAPSGGAIDSCVRDGERPGHNTESPGRNPESPLRNPERGVRNPVEWAMVHLEAPSILGMLTNGTGGKEEFRDCTTNCA